jgi:hypothetical protein
MASSALKKYKTSGYVYKIIDINENKIYIGSTFNTLSKRFCQHKDFYKRYKNGNYEKNAVFDIFDEFGIEKCKIVLVDTLKPPCTKQELLKLEQVYISNEYCVNKLLEQDSKFQKKEYIQLCIPGYVYKIIDINENKIYIGSTFSTLSKRFSEHKTCYKRYKLGNYGKNTVFDIFDEFSVEKCKIVLVDTLNPPCTKQELLKLEQEHISNEFCINKLPAYVSDEQKKEYEQFYYTENKERIQEVSKVYRENPEVKEKIKIRDDIYSQTEEAKKLHRERQQVYSDKNRQPKTDEQIYEEQLIINRRPDNFENLSQIDKENMRKRRARTREKLIQLICMAYNHKSKFLMLGFDCKRKIRIFSNKQKLILDKIVLIDTDINDVTFIKTKEIKTELKENKTGIRYSNYDKSWIFQWSENGKRKSKKFRVCDNSGEEKNKNNQHKITRTYEEAKILAEEFRDKFNKIYFLHASIHVPAIAVHARPASGSSQKFTAAAT